MGYRKFERQGFVETISTFLKTAGATDTGRPMYPQAIETQYGKLWLKLHPQEDHKNVLSLFAKFEEHTRVPAELNANPHNGKWNFHFTCSIPEAVAEIERAIMATLPEKE